MKYSIIILSSLIAGAFARPQASGTITAAPSVVTGLTPAQSCIASCKAGDVNCQAACQGAAHPNSSQVVETTQCAEKCDQGDGSPAATEKYSQCVQACISSYFPTSQTVAAAPGGSQSAASTGSEATGKSGDKSATGTATKATGSAASGTASGAGASSTGAANAHAQMGASAAGIAGLFMAVFAL